MAEFDMDKAAFEDLLKRYLANKCSDRERLVVERLYDLLGEEKSVVIENIDDLEDEMWDRIKVKTSLGEESLTEDITKFLPAKPWHNRIDWRIAASIVLLITSGWGLFQYQSNYSDTNNQQGYSFQHAISNNGDNSKIVWLEDSTKVSLSPDSRLDIQSAFKEHDKREVYLKGEAVFDVTKNPNKPFLVHTGKVITRVIGTSFKIVNRNEANLEVAVLSGKVSVYNEDIRKGQKKTNNGVVLTPNQKVIYHSENKQFVTSVVDEPILLNDKEEDSDESMFVYNETPVEFVLDQLEDNYGIQIEIVENESFIKCPFTANLAKQTLYQKLDMICTSLNATYEVKGIIILINGSGCK